MGGKAEVLYNGGVVDGTREAHKIQMVFKKVGLVIC
jgi:hypothetical protein